MRWPSRGEVRSVVPVCCYLLVVKIDTLHLRSWVITEADVLLPLLLILILLLFISYLLHRCTTCQEGWKELGDTI